ncbi:NAD-dependent protein deacylase [Amphibacillus marinus]|uniref:NAD-dependent protein deacylase n=1 Tax=Amphibacillus marinus TaxID=872970 RepID=UPI000B8636C1|nr:NAD-dependent protein deacylase [Amphibacillus marinus]
MNKLEQLNDYIDAAKQIVFFGGAGVSTESGIPDFRSANGIFHERTSYPPEQILSHSFFHHHPELFFQFYRAHLLTLEAKPNPAHLSLAKLEQLGKLSTVVTQNIDGLHQRAGSKSVIELHGTIHNNYCLNCHQWYTASFVKQNSAIPYCDCGGIIKPDVVLYEEPLNEQAINGAIQSISQADLLIVGGTSLSVYPAAGLIQYFQGTHLVVINKTNLPNHQADLVLNDAIGQVFESLLSDF